MEITLSIVVPVYNAALYLRECIDSLLNQSVDSFEIILVNDGSKDDSASICQEYSNKYSNIIFINQENQGQMVASINGVNAAKGKYIGFVDSDDYIAHNTYELMLAEAEKNDADIVSMAGVRFYKDIEKPFCDKLDSGVYDKKAIDAYIIPNLFSNHDLYGNRGMQPSKCLKLFKAGIIRKAYSLIPSDIAMGEDLLTSYTAIANSSLIVIMDKSLIGYHYRLNPESVSWVHKEKLFERSMKLCRSLREIEQEKDNIIFQREVDYEVCFFAINAFLNEYLMKNKNSFKSRKMALKRIVLSEELTAAISRINTHEVKMPNRIFISLMKKKRINSLHMIGVVISAFRGVILKVSQKVI